MNCIFFGHRDAPSEINAKLKKQITDFINKEEDVSFYVGNNGKFDYYVQIILEELSKNASFNYYIVLSRINEKALSGNQEFTIFPEGLENVLPNFAISKRNEWMLKKADCLIAYATNSFTNAGKLFFKAKKRGILTINLSHSLDDVDN